MSIKEKIADIQVRIHVPKSRYNKFGGFSYRSLEDIFQAIKPELAKHGLHVIINDDVRDVGGRVYVASTATITDGQESISSTGWAREEEARKGMDAPQLTGTASSYARKRALEALLLLDDAEDVDSREPANRAPAKREKPAKPVLNLAENKAALDAIEKWAVDDGLGAEKIIARISKKYTVDDAAAAVINQVVLDAQPPF